MQQYFFKFADVMIEIRIPQKLIVEDSYQEYLIEDKLKDDAKKVDVRIDFIQADATLEPSGNVLYDGISLVTREGSRICIYQHDAGVKEYFSRVTSVSEGRYECIVQKQDWWRFRYSNQIFAYAGIEHILNRKHTMLLHSSHIMWHGKSILFSAPSGTGKSTQADLWKLYEDAEIINGDRSAIRCHDGEVYAYGIPYAGSSRIFVNKSATIGAIVVLRQAPENSIRRMRHAEAFRMIYSESTVQGWDSTYIDILCDILEEIVRKIPVYLLSCRPDQEAVEILRKELETC